MIEMPRGLSLFIWQMQECEGGNIEAIAAQLRSVGAGAVIVKAADGTEPWDQWNNNNIDVLKRNGLQVWGWQYVYPNLPVAQAILAARLAAMADGWIFDAEHEWEQGAVEDAIASLTSTFRKIIARPFGLTTFAEPFYHPLFPYSQWMRSGAGFWMPQMYTTDMGYGDNVSGGCRDIMSSIVRDGRTRGWPLLPVGQAFSPATDYQMHLFATECAHRWTSLGLCWWSYQHVAGIPHGWREIASYAASHY